MPVDDEIRPFDPSRDTIGALQLINYDRVLGQPICTAEMLAEATAGRSAVDGGWWHKLNKPRIDVLVIKNRLAGIVSFADDQEEDSSFLLWLHAREDPRAVALLTDHFVQSTKASKLYGYYIATALTSGLEGLPVKHRPVTHAEMLGQGFKDLNAWRYMHIHTPVPDISVVPNAPVQEQETESDHEREWLIPLVQDGKKIGAALTGSIFPEIGVLWHITVDDEQRGKGLGRLLLGTAINQLTETHAKEIILYVDDDDPRDRDRTAANRLYDLTGFKEIDRLHSYEMERARQ